VTKTVFIPTPSKSTNHVICLDVQEEATDPNPAVNQVPVHYLKQNKMGSCIIGLL